MNTGPSGRTPGHSRGALRSARVQIAIATCFGLWPSAAALADGDTNAWIVVAAADSEERVTEALARAEALEAELRSKAPGSAVQVLAPEEGRARFASSGSSEVTVLDPARVRELRARIGRATSLLALGRFNEAKIELDAVRSLPAPQQDWLRRELDDAQELLDVCIVAASRAADAGDAPAGAHQMEECVRSMPSVRSAPTYHAPEARELYERAVAQLERGRGAAQLVLRDASSQACVVRINGAPAGPAPAALELVPVAIRVQLECGGQTGRIHRVDLRPGFNEVIVDAEFDHAIRDGAPRVRFRYSDPARLWQRAGRDGLTLARAVEADAVLWVEVSEQITVQRFNRDGTSIRVDWRAPVHDSVALDRVARTLLGREPAENHVVRSPSNHVVRSPSNHASALPVVSWTDSTSWIVPTGIALGYSTAIASSVFALVRRADVRQNALSSGSFDINRYRDNERVGVIGTASGAALATGMEVVGLPYRPTVPWWAWAAGGAGAAAVGVAALLSPEPRCKQMVTLRSCSAVSEDPLLRTLLLIHAVPLLTVPLTYALSAALGVEAGAEFNDGARLELRGRF